MYTIIYIGSNKNMSCSQQTVACGLLKISKSLQESHEKLSTSTEGKNTYYESLKKDLVMYSI